MYCVVRATSPPRVGRYPNEIISPTPVRPVSAAALGHGRVQIHRRDRLRPPQGLLRAFIIDGDGHVVDRRRGSGPAGEWRGPRISEAPPTILSRRYFFTL